MLTKNLSVREVVASDTILINQRLAELYGIRGIAGAELREVKVPAGTPRGGFHDSSRGFESDRQRNSHVARFAWRLGHGARSWHSAPAAAAEHSGRRTGRNWSSDDSPDDREAPRRFSLRVVPCKNGSSGPRTRVV